MFFQPKGPTTFHVYVNTLSLRVPRVLYDHWNGTRFLFNKDLFPDKLKNFNGLVLRATSFNYPPYTYQARPQITFQLRQRDFENFLDFFRIYFKKWILDPCIRKRTEAGVAGNFSSWKLSHQTSTLPWIFSRHPTGSSGGRIRTDHLLVNVLCLTLSREIKDFLCWGLVGQLQKEESDIGWADLFLIPDRMKYIDYTAPYIVEYASFMLGHNQTARWHHTNDNVLMSWGSP